MELTAEFVQQILASFLRRSEMIRLAGGVALKDVVDGTAIVPDGWVIDYETQFYIPPGLVFCDTVQ